MAQPERPKTPATLGTAYLQLAAELFGAATNTQRVSIPKTCYSCNSCNRPHEDAEIEGTTVTCSGGEHVTGDVTRNGRPPTAQPGLHLWLHVPGGTCNRARLEDPTADGATFEQVTPVTRVTSSGGRDTLDVGPQAVAAGPAPLEAPVTLVRAPAELGVVQRLGRLVALDLETVGLDPHQGRIRLVALSDGEQVVLLDAAALSRNALAAALRQLAHGRVVALHHGAFDLGYLLVHGLPLPTALRDTMLEAMLLDAGQRLHQRGTFTLEALAAEWLGLTVDKRLQTSDWSGALSAEQLAYAARDALVTWRLAERLQPELARAGLTEAAALEARALPFVAWLRVTGLPWDQEAWEQAVAGAEREQTEAAVALRALLPADGLFGATVNLDSPKALKAALSQLGLALEDTQDETLALLDHPVAAALRRYRKAAKYASSYPRDWATVHPVTGRVHPDWRQLGAATGRMSCSAPPVQQLPREGGFRRAVAAPAGRVLVKLDYAQIELRVVAELADEERLIEAFVRGEDVHRKTARLVLGVQEPSRAERQRAKALNFGLLYGMSTEGFRRHAAAEFGLRLSPAEAAQLIERFFAAYPKLRTWQARQQRTGAGDVRTRSGRLRSDVRRPTERMNTPVQGTAADGLKAALSLLWEQRHRLGSAVPVLVAHDEVVLECALHEADRVAWEAAELLRQGMGWYLHRVPVVVETTVCRDWAGTPVRQEEA
ncbi:DNA polymerase [Thermomicrobium sp. CFH 73360]|uniref:DNA polymerase n=1 Tax=Thermomicrobium sp. CFH 73360 TaxID=2951987 RepID=UPI00207765DE|nr:DNA polymerase [Thermomicrobium sp. CFH 73360]MCM8746784.1 DNA polymerase [Thermomicrobium sp. CFH 73360]